MSKKCVISFRHKGQFISLKKMSFSDRAAAVSYVKACYRGAINISIVFYTPISMQETV